MQIFACFSDVPEKKPAETKSDRWTVFNNAQYSRRRIATNRQVWQTSTHSHKNSSIITIIQCTHTRTDWMTDSELAYIPQQQQRRLESVGSAEEKRSNTHFNWLKSLIQLSVTEKCREIYQHTRARKKSCSFPRYSTSRWKKSFFFMQLLQSTIVNVVYGWWWCM